MLSFCLHSLLREYGWQFVRHVAAVRPLRTFRALLAAERLDIDAGVVATDSPAPAPGTDPGRFVVAAGFCMKPLDPPCPSGRFNHDCQYLERLGREEEPPMPAGCQGCAIRGIGMQALRAGTAFYIMTSARDILFDLFVPAIRRRRLAAGIFVLCRYSLRPFATGLLASGIRGWMLPFERGDCADYRTWLRADRGRKDEQTAVHPQNRRSIGELLQTVEKPATPARSFHKQGQLFWPTDEETDCPAGRSCNSPRD